MRIVLSKREKKKLHPEYKKSIRYVNRVLNTYPVLISRIVPSDITLHVRVKK